MNLYTLPDEERRALCRRILESLEFWLRRLIDDKLRPALGADYINATLPNGDPYFSNAVRNGMNGRRTAEPTRYPRLIDAALLDDAITIICHQNLYQQHFHAAFSGAFPNGSAETRTFLTRLLGPRNNLSHANGISVRQAEQVVCYSNDVIESLKQHYITIGQAQEFNVPTVIKSTDSFGNVFYFNEDSVGYSLRDNANFHLRPGDTLTIDLEIDPSWDDDKYTLQWVGNGVTGNAKRLVLPIQTMHINNTFTIECRVTSTETWHKFGTFDHNFHCNYRVLPPL